jgi:integrase
VKQLDDLILQDLNTTEKDIQRYIKYLKYDKKLSVGYVREIKSAIKHFFYMNNIILNWERLSKFVGKYQKVNEDREYTTDEIGTLLAVSDLKYKAVILLMASSGVRKGAIHPLKFGDLTEIPINNNEYIYKVTVYRKTPDQYFTFTTPEATKSLNEYLDYRRQNGENITATSPLFRDDLNPTPKPKKDVKGEAARIAHIKNPNPLTYEAVKSRLRQLSIKAGVGKYEPLSENNKPGVRHNPVQVAHGLRKFFTTNCKRAKVDTEIRILLEGHKLPGSEDPYLEGLTDIDILKEYLKAVNKLSINQEVNLKIEVEELKEENSEIEKLKEQIKTLIANQTEISKRLFKGGVLKKS